MADLDPVWLYSFFEELLDQGHLAFFLSNTLGREVLFEILVMEELVTVLWPWLHAARASLLVFEDSCDAKLLKLNDGATWAG